MTIWREPVNGILVVLTTRVGMTELLVPRDTEIAQANATDPKVSAWVSANAGSGKTHVLTQRVVHLMLEGTPPSRILCLTFTNAAAAEMSNRVFQLLAKWTMADPPTLKNEISKVVGNKPSAKLLRRARQLFALALDAPGGLKIQTIHAFCESLLHQFPLEANVTGHFTILDEFTQDTLLEEARRSVFLLAQQSDSRLADAFNVAMEFAGDEAIENAIQELIRNRSAFTDWVDGDVERALQPVHRQSNIEQSASRQEIFQQADQILGAPDSYWSELIEAAESDGAQNNLDRAAFLKNAIAADSVKSRFSWLEEFFLTKEGKARSRLFYGNLVKNSEQLIERLKQTQIAFEHALAHIRAWEMLRASKALFQIGEQVLHRYKFLKQARGLVDYDDMITEAANLLSRSDIRQWVQYKLDRGIDHVLVDEAQDTSPRQWDIINAVIEDYHSGQSAGRENRTVFVVGDEKQSIFSFQGAEPGTFNQQHHKLQRAVKNSGSGFNSENLRHSFRSTNAIISAVDRVFSIAENARGLSSGNTAIIHETIRGGDYGEVLVWPLFEAKKSEKSTAWLPEDHSLSPSDPAQSLADRIADDIAGLVGKVFAPKKGPFRYGDILVLVRKRDRFVNILTKTLKERGFPIAGVDRLKLTEHIAIQDLLALAKFALLPQDDLSLASLLKSPVFNLNEDELFELAHDRDAIGLFEHLQFLVTEGQETSVAKLYSIVKQLSSYIAQAKHTSVFDFFSRILSADGGRNLFLARLGTEAEEILDAFLEAAMEHDQTDRRGLEEFVSKMQTASPEVKRQVDSARDEIRIMTVHSAKGLEASMVYLVDSCAKPFDGQHRARIQEVKLPDGKTGYLWQATKQQQIPLTGQSIEIEKQNAEEEYRRLLYVGMTRAKDRLVVCGYKGSNTINHHHWHAMVDNALLDGSETLPFEGAEKDAIRWKTDGNCSESPQDMSSKLDQPCDTAAIPAWARTKPAREHPAPQPLTATGAYLTFAGVEMEQYSPPNKSDMQSTANPALCGTLMHKLLQYLPDCPSKDRRSLAETFLMRSRDSISSEEQQFIIYQVMAILQSDEYCHLFAPDTKPEVSIVGSILVGGTERTVVGQIDRLVVGQDEITILDYKSGVRIPENPSQIPGAYLSQLAIYRHVLETIHPEKKIHCALLWTSGPKLMWVPKTLLADAMSAINNG